MGIEYLRGDPPGGMGGWLFRRKWVALGLGNPPPPRREGSARGSGAASAGWVPKAPEEKSCLKSLPKVPKKCTFLGSILHLEKIGACGTERKNL